MEYIWQAEKNQNQSETQDIINRLSKSLKEELLINANGLIIKETPLLNNNFSEDTLRKVVSEMKEVSLTPGDILYHENDILNHNLYIVRDGEVELYLESANPKRKTSLQIIKKGQHFGETSFFSGVPRKTSAQCLSFSSLFVIKKDDFFDILKENTEDFEKFHEIKDRINLIEDFSKLFHHCSCCKSFDHESLSCPLIHLNLSKAMIIERYNYSLPHERCSSFKRRKKFPCNSLSNYQKNIKKAKQFFDDIFEPQDSSPVGTYENLESLISENQQKIQEPPSLKVISPLKLDDKSFELKRTTTLSSLLRKNDRMATFERKETEEKKELGIMPTQSLLTINENVVEKRNIDVDMVKSYNLYYPNHNVEKFIENFNRMFEKKRKRLKTIQSLFNFNSNVNITGQNSNFTLLRSKTQRKIRENSIGCTEDKQFFGGINSVKRTLSNFLQKKKRNSISSKKNLYLMRMFKWILKCFKNKK